MSVIHLEPRDRNVAVNGPPSVRLVAAGLSALAAIAIVLAYPCAADAASYTWTGNASTNWGAAGNWHPATVPGPADEADFGGIFTNSPSLSNSPYVGQLHTLGNLSQSFTATVNSGLLSLMATNNGNIGILVNQDSSPNNVVTLSGPGTVQASNFESLAQQQHQRHGFRNTGQRAIFARCFVERQYGLRNYAHIGRQRQHLDQRRHLRFAGPVDQNRKRQPSSHRVEHLFRDYDN